MSNTAINWAFQQQLLPGPKFVLVVLADLADEEHSCYPGQLYLAERTGHGERTVRRYLQELVDTGYLTRKSRYDEQGHRTSDRYVLPVHDLPANPAGSRPVNVAADLPANDDHLPANAAGSLPANHDLPANVAGRLPANDDAKRADYRPTTSVTTGQPGRVSLRSTTPEIRTRTEPKEHVSDRRGAAARDPDAVERVCIYLADRIEGNTGRRPTITTNWRDAARLMMDRDHVPENLIMGSINWSQNSEFWRCNILSMPKLREKYLTMKLQAERDRQNGHSTTDDRVAQGLRVRDELLAEEAARAAHTSRKELTQ